MLNAIFGKCLENVRLHRDIEVIMNRHTLLRRLAKPNFKSINIFREDLAAVQMTKTSLLLNKPIIVGYSILELSKVSKNK